MSNLKSLATLVRYRARRLKHQIALAVVLTAVALGFLASAISAGSSRQAVDTARVFLTLD